MVKGQSIKMRDGSELTDCFTGPFSLLLSSSLL